MTHTHAYSCINGTYDDGTYYSFTSACRQELDVSLVRLSNKAVQVIWQRKEEVQALPSLATNISAFFRSLFVIPEPLASIRAVVLAFTANAMTSLFSFEIVYLSKCDVFYTYL